MRRKREPRKGRYRFKVLGLPQPPDQLEVALSVLGAEGFALVASYPDCLVLQARAKKQRRDEP